MKKTGKRPQKEGRGTWQALRLPDTVKEYGLKKDKKRKAKS